jgi:hypothetical protein
MTYPTSNGAVQTQSTNGATYTPAPAFSQHETLSILVHAGSKVGKSTFASSAPKPILVLDAEGSWKFIPTRKKYWDPAAEPPPVYDGTWDSCHVTVREWKTIDLVYRWLTQYQTPFVSIAIDSITEIQRRCKENLVGTEAMRTQDWGVLLTLLDGVIRGFRDLMLFPQLNVRCVIFVSETKEIGGKWRPYMQGAIATSLPYFVDLEGYLYPDFELDMNGQPTREVRRLLISPHPQFEAGERVQGRLGGVLTIQKPPYNTVGQDIEIAMHQLYGHYAPAYQ